MPAKSLYSYVDTLYTILDTFKPQTVFEWGPGTSTQVIALYPSVQKLTSVEHEIVFYDIIERLNFGNVTFHYKEDMDEYVGAIGTQLYDLVFVDGRDRSRCLKCAKELTNLVVLHDAARADYRDAVNEFCYQVWTDEGNTAVLTNDKETYEKAKEALSSMAVPTPSPEKVRMVGHSAVKGEVF